MFPHIAGCTTPTVKRQIQPRREHTHTHIDSGKRAGEAKISYYLYSENESVQEQGIKC